MSSAETSNDLLPKKEKKKVKKEQLKKKVNSDTPCEVENIHQDETSSVKVSARSLSSFHMDNRGICLNPECDSEPDRSDPLWKIVPDEGNEDEQTQESSDDLIKNKPNLWNEIMTEYEDKREEFNSLRELSKPFEPILPVYSKLSAVQYLDKHVFPLLCPALQETLFKAKEWDCLMTQKGRFNGLDYISELLWNRNPLHPRRLYKYRNIFDIPFAIIRLYHNPRPIYPLSWLWSKEEAIIVLQSYIRRYLVCKETECSEMRQFWKAIKIEKEETMQARRMKSIELVEIVFNEILDKLVADAVFEVEFKLHGCKCIKKPCPCVCNCTKWCKCCKCYKVPNHNPSCNCVKTTQELRKQKTT